MQRTFFAAVSFAAIAALPMTAAPAFAGDWYAGIAGGTTFGSSSASALASTLVSRVGGVAAVAEDENVGVGRIYGGYQINSNLEAELGYFKSANANATFTGISGNGTSYAGSATASVSGFDYSLVAHPNFLPGLYARVGAHSSHIDESATLDVNGSTASGSFGHSGTSLLLGLGYDYPLQNNFVGRIEYTRYNRLGGVDANANLLSFGAKYLF